MENIEQYATLDQLIASAQRELFFNVLQRARWNAAHAARELGITYRVMRHRMAKSGLTRDTYRRTIP
jgi:transcriptional regulator with GAF, ATPase, and Fis domain